MKALLLRKTCNCILYKVVLSNNEIVSGMMIYPNNWSAAYGYRRAIKYFGEVK